MPVSASTEQRLAVLEQKIAEHEKLIAKLKVYARLTAAGRALLKAIGS
jgi:uncharacterized coiled-coil protein SlyX